MELHHVFHHYLAVPLTLRAALAPCAYWWWGLACLTLVRLVLAASIPLSPDEAYYRIWALAPAGGYLDHPPMVALWARMGMLLVGDTALGVRLLGPVSTCLASVLIVQSAWCWLQGQVTPEQVRAGGLRAGLLFNGTLSVGLGTLVMTPDTPLLFFMALLLWGLVRACIGGQRRMWLLAGLAAGLGFDSKYTMLLPLAGLGLWLLATKEGRSWLRTPWPYCAAGLALVCTVPVIWWNAEHAWASFAKQGGRVGDWNPAHALAFMGELLGGQVGLASPLVFVFFVGSVWLLWRRRSSFATLLLCMVALPAVVFAQHALGARVQANWPVVLYPVLSLAAAQVAWPWWRSAGFVGIGLAGVVGVQAAFMPLRLSPHLDMTLRQMGGWPDFARSVSARVPEGAPLVADEYGLASELAFYAPERVVLGAEPRWRLFSLPHPACGTQAYLVLSHKRAGPPDDHLFEVLETLPEQGRMRSGIVADTYALFHVRLRCPIPGQVYGAALLPGRGR
ncbi:glycosyltransferase family 39 protein [Acetobacter okinawensis]|uniref:glycosyltransferase family 39 protein n=1 Tax=Acetobacter okinawensis TaxID=1076594 RepID=UPI001FD1BDCB|nr:glycosyltransferase family 39 protein [Acetobacter okinawensis]